MKYKLSNIQKKIVRALMDKGQYTAQGSREASAIWKLKEIFPKFIVDANSGVGERIKAYNFGMSIKSVPEPWSVVTIYTPEEWKRIGK